MHILGVDPGASGALVIYNTTHHNLTVYDMPTVHVKRGARVVNQVSASLVAGIMTAHKINYVFCEKVGAMPGQGVSSMFAFGRAAGIIEGVAAGIGLPFTLITPQEWQRGMHVIGGKDGSRSRAAEFFPHHAMEFARKKDDGRADAALIAAYGATLVGTK